MSQRVEKRQEARAAARKPIDDYDVSPYGLNRANRRARLDREGTGENPRSNRSDAPPKPKPSAQELRRRRRRQRIAAERIERAFVRKLRNGARRPGDIKP